MRGKFLHIPNRIFEKLRSGSSSTSSPETKSSWRNSSAIASFSSRSSILRSSSAGIIGGIKATTPCTVSRNNSKMHQRAACKQVEMAAAVAASRTEAHMASRFRDVEKSEAHCSFQQRGLLTEITSEFSPGTRSSATRSVSTGCSRDDTRDTHNADTLSQLRSELQHYHQRAEAQSDEFQSSHKRD